ncbi:putative helicase MOV-10 [Phymastichus coffea]|uniref:putative helicase MOV-10 n=1 Tax=Phymastichus coffea TaxID=108790 RepID=UPI00273B3651|nr:putative helicase MOV-10 [Phymastichus coffea]XP_058807140.1 putative helicase MOV-10 [Phymastichus coffea]
MYSKQRNLKQTKNDRKNSYFLPPSRPVIPEYPIPKDLIPVVINNLKPFVGMTDKNVQFMQILKQIQNNEGIELKVSNYLKLFKLMLYVEEIQNNLDMKRYDLHKKKITRLMDSSKHFKINVEELIEELPSIRPDVLEICDLQTKLLYRFDVTNVMDDHIIAIATKKFCTAYSSEKFYDIRFIFHNYPIRCCHYTLCLINLYELTPLFFPIKHSTFIEEGSNIFWYNKNIESNPEQKQAVLNIKSKSSQPYPYILYGPPGTGKTSTIVEAICQIWQANPSDNILVCTPSNTAADVITKKLLAYKDYIPERDLYRMYSVSNEGSKIDEEILGCSNFIEGQVMMLPKELIKNKKIVITTLCTCMRLLFLNFKEKHFSYVFIDEAGQATEPEALIPFNLLSSIKEGRIGRLHSQVIIAGDPYQLGPGIQSKLAESILGRSMLERLMDCEPYKRNEHGQYHPGYITKLLQNYRSHPEIIKVSNEIFYESELKACGNDNIYKAIDWPYLVNKKFPIIFHNVEGTEVKANRSTSSYNIEEIKVVRYYVKHLMRNPMKKPLPENEIGIVTPFTAQKLKIKRVLQEDNYLNVDVGTVELFQGQEKDVIILSTVRSKTFKHDDEKHIGFLSNPKRFNVALTRTKALLIVVGNQKVLQIDKNWKYFLQFCKNNNACRGNPFDIKNDSRGECGKPHKQPKIVVPSVLDNFSTIDVVDLDDGVEVSPPESVVDENEYPKSVRKQSSFKTFNGCPQAIAPRTKVKLSDIQIKSMADIKLEKQAMKKEKRKKKKQHMSEELTK